MFGMHGRELWDGSSTLCGHRGLERLAVHLATASVWTGTCSQGILNHQEWGGGTAPRAGEGGYPHSQPEPSFLQPHRKSRPAPTLPTWMKKSDGQSSLLLSCAAPCRHHPDPSASRQCHLPSGRHLNSEMPKEQRGI